MKIAIVQSHSDDDLNACHGRSLCDALNELGHSSVILKTPTGSPVFDFATALHEQKIEAALSFGGLLGGITFGDGSSIFERLGVRFIAWMFDHPLHVMRHLDVQADGRVLILPHASHCAFSDRFGLKGTRRIMLSGVDPLPSSTRRFQERDIPLLVVARWRGEPVRVWEQLPDSPAKDLCRQAAERLIADAELSLIDCWDAACADLGLNAPLSDGTVEAMREILIYVRHRDRIELLRQLTESGHPMTIVGSGWDEHLGSNPSVTFLDNVAFADLPEFYARAKVVFHVNSANGGCERSLSAMMAGAAALSDFSSTYSLSGLDDRHIKFYDRTKPESVVEALEQLHVDSHAEEVADAGYRRAFSDHSWRCRAASLVETLTDVMPTGSKNPSTR